MAAKRTSLKRLHEISTQIAEQADSTLPAEVDILISNKREPPDKWHIEITILTWPEEIVVLNANRIAAERRSLLAGRSSDMSFYPDLSIVGESLGRVLHEIMTPFLTDKIHGQIYFNGPAIRAEQDRILKSIEASERFPRRPRPERPHSLPRL